MVFRIPGQPPLRFVHVTQRTLTDVLGKVGALGFVTEAGCSQELDDLPEDGEVEVVLLREWPMFTQVRFWFACQPAMFVGGWEHAWLRGLPAWLLVIRALHGKDTAARSAEAPCVLLSTSNSATPTFCAAARPAGRYNSTRGKEVEMGAFLRTLASAENPDVSCIELKTTPFKDDNAQVRSGGRPALQLPRRMHAAEAAAMALPPGAVVPARAMIPGCWQVLPPHCSAASAPQQQETSLVPLAPLICLPAQDYLQIDAGVKAGHLLYMGEHKHVLNEASVADLAAKFMKLRWVGWQAHAGRQACGQA